MSTNKKLEWALRIGVAGEFLGHGVLAIQGKADWIKWIGDMVNVEASTASTLLLFIGLLDVLVALTVLFKPMSKVLLWAVFWGFWTALVRPLVGQPIWDFIERFANWAAPLALYYYYKQNRS